MQVSPQARSYALTFGSRICVIGLTALFGILSARLLGPTDKGIYTVASLFPAAISTVAMLAGPQLVVTDFSKGLSSARLKKLLAWSIWIACAGGLICLTLQLASTTPPSMTSLAASSLALFAPALIVPEYLAAALQASGRFGHLSLLRIFQVAGPGCLMLIGVVTNGILGGLVGFGSGTMLVGLGSYIAWRVEYTPRLVADGSRIPWRFVITTNLTLVLLFLSYRLDVLVLEAVASSESVGIYTAAVALAELVLVVSMSAAVVRAPLYARQKHHSLKRDSWLVLGLSALTGVAIAALCPFLIPLLFGDDYRESIQVVWALLPGICCLAAYRYISNAEIVRGHKYGLLASCLVSIATDVVLIFSLSPTLGAVGAGLAASSSYAAGLIYLLVHRQLRPAPRFLEGNYATRNEARAKTKGRVM